MTDRSATKLVLWPFILVDLLFLGLAFLIFSYAHRPLLLWEAFALVLCAALGAWSFLTPFLRRNEVDVKFAESDNLTSTVSQIKNLDQIAAQLGTAIMQLKTAQDESRHTVDAAKGISEKMAEESRAFAEFIQKANDSEKNHLRLEVDKLRRAEVDWLQVVVHMLDHVFALHQAAVRSGKPALAEQIGNFQNACRDTVRRMGLVCHAPDGESPFDENIHQLPDGETKPENGALVSEILASGYSYQGRVVRRALVRVKAENATVTSETTEPSEPNESTPETVEDAPQKSLF